MCRIQSFVKYLYQRITQIIELLGCHVDLLPDVINTTSHEDAPRGFSSQDGNHVSTQHILYLAPERYLIQTYVCRTETVKT